MEEILASIRRIIEDSDAAKTAEEERRQPAASVPPPANDTIVEVQAFRESLKPSKAETVRPERRQSMAEIGAFARLSAIDREMEASTETEAEETQEVNEPAGAATFSAAERREVEEPQMPELDQLDLEPEPAAPSGAAVAAADEHRQSIISEQAGRQVAAAFGELSEVFAATRRRSFDEMAEEMIRPMLREWMDNNLPVLVERLVREEIERVARGA